MKPCKFCDSPITLRKEGEKWLPFNENGSQHYCQRPEPIGSTPANLSSAMEGRIRQIAREVAEQVFKENTGS